MRASIVFIFTAILPLASFHSEGFASSLPDASHWHIARYITQHFHWLRCWLIFTPFHITLDNYMY